VATISLEGTGTSISFSASGFSADIISVDLNDRARQTIDTTHLGTRGAKTYKPGEVVDLGEMTVVVDHNPNELQLVGYPPEPITINYPLQDGEVVPTKIPLTGYIVSQGEQQMQMDKRMVTRLVIQLRNSEEKTPITQDEPPSASDYVPLHGYAKQLVSSGYSSQDAYTSAEVGFTNATASGLPNSNTWMIPIKVRASTERGTYNGIAINKYAVTGGTAGSGIDNYKMTVRNAANVVQHEFWLNADDVSTITPGPGSDAYYQYDVLVPMQNGWSVSLSTSNVNGSSRWFPFSVKGPSRIPVSEMNGTENGQLYSGTIFFDPYLQVDSFGIAVDSGGLDSPGVLDANTPAILPALIGISDATPVVIRFYVSNGYAIYYTTDGSTPTISSTVYTAPFTLAQGTRTVKAIGIRSGFPDTAIAQRTYTVANETPYLWYKAENYSAGGNWTDSGAAGCDLVLNSGAAPTVTADGPQWAMDGSTGALKPSGSVPPSWSTVTTFIVCKNSITGSQAVFHCTSGGNSHHAPGLQLNYPADGSAVVHGGPSAHREIRTSGGASAGMTSGAKKLLYYEYGASDFVRCELDGAPAAFSTPSFSGSLGENSGHTPIYFYVGGDPTGDDGPFKGTISEIIVFNRSLTASEKAYYTTYLKNKFGIA
jgi:hypothetical protein